MNCHNGEKFLKESLRSIIFQTYKNWELIFFDNNSSDNSIKIVKNLNDKRIKILKNKKYLTLYNARNLAIKKTKGTYIAFLDVDDTWEKSKLKTQINFLLKNKSFQLAYSNYLVKDQIRNIRYLKFKKKLKSGYITQQLLDDYTIGILTTLIKKKALKKINFNKKYNIIGDFDCFVQISLKNKIAYIDKPLATYRLHRDNFTFKNMKLYIKEMSVWLKDNKPKYLKKNYSLMRQHWYLLKLKFKYILKSSLGV